MLRIYSDNRCFIDDIFCLHASRSIESFVTEDRLWAIEFGLNEGGYFV